MRDAADSDFALIAGEAFSCVDLEEELEDAEEPFSPAPPDGGGKADVAGTPGLFSTTTAVGP